MFYLSACVSDRVSLSRKATYGKLDAMNIRWMFILRVRVNLSGSFKLAYRVYTLPSRELCNYFTKLITRRCMQFRSVRQTVELTGHALYGC